MAFAFAFDNSKYSDRKLRLLIQTDSKSEDQSPDFGRVCKRRRISPSSAEPSSPEPIGLQTEELFINTLILAKESVFFRKIFDGECFKESSQKVIDIHLSSDEKEPFLDLVKYLYTDKLEAETADKLVAVWHLSQRFMVESCVDLCMQKLRTLPLSLESSCYFIECADVVNQTEEFKGLMARSIPFLVNHFRGALVMNGENPNRLSHSDDFKQLSAQVLESLLASDDLQVIFEECLYYAVRTWISFNYEDKEQHINAWKRFGPLIRWPRMEMFRVKALLGKIEGDSLRDLLLEALLYHASTDDEKAAMESSSNNHRFRRRARHAVPVNFISVNLPVTRGLIFFSLSREEWVYLQQGNGPVCTQRFSLGGCIFIWLVQVRSTFRASDKRRVSALLVALNSPSTSLRVDMSLSVWDVQSGTYGPRYKGVHVLKKAAKERIAMCLDCFGRDIDSIMDSEFIYKDATWFRTEVQVDRGDVLL